MMLIKKNLGLIIESDPVMREKIKRLLTGKFETIVAMSRAKEVLDVFNDLKPDLVVTDYQLPDLDGEQLIETLKGQDAAIPSLLLATQCPNIVILNLLRFEKFAALQMPFEPMTFLHAINLILKSKLISPFPQPRSAYRVDIVLPTHIDHCGYGRTINVSLTGALIEINEDCKIGGEVISHFYLPEELVLRGVVVWHQSASSNRQQQGGLGVRFQDNPKEVIECLRVYLANSISLKQRGWIIEQTKSLSEIS